jgi:hypothetical protein
MFVLLLPWTLRNYRAFGEAIPVSTNGGVNFFIGNNPFSTGTYHLTSVQNIPGSTELERNRLGYSKGMQFVASNPCRFLIRGIQKMYYMYGNELLAMDWSFYSVQNRGPLRTAATYIAQAAYLLIMLGAVVGLRMWFGNRNTKLLLPMLVIGAWSLIHFVYFGESRFHYPLIPLFAVFAAVACLKAAGVNGKKEIAGPEDSPVN